MRRVCLIAVPYLWLLALFLVPFLIVLKISLSDIALAIPPYTPTLDFGEGWAGIKEFFAALDFENFDFLTTDDLYWKAYLSSLQIALIATLLTLLVGYPIAYGMARARSLAPDTDDAGDPAVLDQLPDPGLFLDGDPLERGVSEPVAALDRVISEPLTILNTNIAVYIGIVYTYLPFMILPIYAALERMDASLLEAAEDLGCSPHHRVLAGHIPAVARTASSRAAFWCSSRRLANS